MKRIRVIHHEGHEVGNIIRGEAPSMVSMIFMVSQLFVFEDFITMGTWRAWSTGQEDRDEG